MREKRICLLHVILVTTIGYYELSLDLMGEWFLGFANLLKFRNPVSVLAATESISNCRIH